MNNPQYALFGQPVALSLSPKIHQYFASSLNQTINYNKSEISEDIFAAAVQNFFEGNDGGLNITVPHKLSAFNLAQITTPAAEDAKAVNTLWMKNGKLHGDNTDGSGFIKDLIQKEIGITDRKIIILGAGGAVRGILGPILKLDPELLIIANRTVDKAEALSASFIDNGTIQSCSLTDIPTAIPDTQFDLVINGLSAHQFPQQINPKLSKDAVYYDLKYGKAAESGINWASQQSFSILCDGWGMLVRQAAESYFIWLGKMPDPEPLINNPELVSKTQTD